MRQDNKSVGSPPPVFTPESQDASQCREADEGRREVDRACVSAMHRFATERTQRLPRPASRHPADRLIHSAAA